MRIGITVALLLALPLFAVASPVPAPVARLPIRRRTFQLDDGTADIPALVAEVNAASAKVARGFAAFKANTGETHPNDNGSPPTIITPAKRSLARRATSRVGLTNDDFDLWQGGVSVGTPLRPFTVDFDTGSSDFFLPGARCTSNCQGHRVFSTAASSTAVDQKQTFSIEFADGSSVDGEVFTDTVSLGGLVATAQPVVAATQYSAGFNINEFPPDGLLGLAFISISETGRSPVFESLVLQNKTTSPTFGVTLTNNGGELFLGGTDTSAFRGSLTFSPLTERNPPAFWEIEVSSVAVGRRTVVSTVQDAIVDTGTTLLIVDPASARAIYAQIPGAEDASNVIGPGFFVVPCNAVPSNVAFTIGGQALTLSSATFNFGPIEPGSNACVGGIMGANEGFWILGDVFLRNFYTQFDFGNLQVGFAPLA